VVHAFERVAGAGDGVFRAFDLDLVAARGNVDAEAIFDLYEIGIELAEQGPQQSLFVELDFDTRPAMCFGPELRRFTGTCCFAGHVLLSDEDASFCLEDGSVRRFLQGVSIGKLRSSWGITARFGALSGDLSQG
jgi:hypothetical protein